MAVTFANIYQGWTSTMPGSTFFMTAPSAVAMPQLSAQDSYICHPRACPEQGRREGGDPVSASRLSPGLAKDLSSFMNGLDPVTGASLNTGMLTAALRSFGSKSGRNESNAAQGIELFVEGPRERKNADEPAVARLAIPGGGTISKKERKVLRRIEEESDLLRKIEKKLIRIVKKNPEDANLIELMVSNPEIATKHLKGFRKHPAFDRITRPHHPKPAAKQIAWGWNDASDQYQVKVGHSIQIVSGRHVPAGSKFPQYKPGVIEFHPKFHDELGRMKRRIYEAVGLLKPAASDKK